TDVRFGLELRNAHAKADRRCAVAAERAEPHIFSGHEIEHGVALLDCRIRTVEARHFPGCECVMAPYRVIVFPGFLDKIRRRLLMQRLLSVAAAKTDRSRERPVGAGRREADLAFAAEAVTRQPLRGQRRDGVIWRRLVLEDKIGREDRLAGIDAFELPAQFDPHGRPVGIFAGLGALPDHRGEQSKRRSRGQQLPAQVAGLCVGICQFAHCYAPPVMTLLPLSFLAKRSEVSRRNFPIALTSSSSGAGRSAWDRSGRRWWSGLNRRYSGTRR